MTRATRRGTVGTMPTRRVKRWTVPDIRFPASHDRSPVRHTGRHTPVRPPIGTHRSSHRSAHTGQATGRHTPVKPPTGEHRVLVAAPREPGASQVSRPRHPGPSSIDAVAPGAAQLVTPPRQPIAAAQPVASARRPANRPTGRHRPRLGPLPRARTPLHQLPQGTRSRRQHRT